MPPREMHRSAFEELMGLLRQNIFLAAYETSQDSARDGLLTAALEHYVAVFGRSGYQARMLYYSTDELMDQSESLGVAFSEVEFKKRLQTAEKSEKNAPYTLAMKTRDANNPSKNAQRNTSDFITIDLTYYRDPTTRVAQVAALANAIQAKVAQPLRQLSSDCK